jgi:nucleoside-diphosphate-sugar epimerase
MININELADIICNVAGVVLSKRHVPGPQGVRGRNSDNALLRRVLGWSPETSLEEGLARTYSWIEKQVVLSRASRSAFRPQRLPKPMTTHQ